MMLMKYIEKFLKKISEIFKSPGIYHKYIVRPSLLGIDLRTQWFYTFEFKNPLVPNAA